MQLSWQLTTSSQLERQNAVLAHDPLTHPAQDSKPSRRALRCSAGAKFQHFQRGSSRRFALKLRALQTLGSPQLRHICKDESRFTSSVVHRRFARVVGEDRPGIRDVRAARTQTPRALARELRGVDLQSDLLPSLSSASASDETQRTARLKDSLAEMIQSKRAAQSDAPAFRSMSAICQIRPHSSAAGRMKLRDGTPKPAGTRDSSPKPGRRCHLRPGKNQLQRAAQQCTVTALESTSGVGQAALSINPTWPWTSQGHGSR